jgi:DNA-binding transcriptional LysR family regulator
MALIEVFETDLLPTDHELARQQIGWALAEDFVLDLSRPIPYVTYHRDCFYKAWAEHALAQRGCKLRVVFECPSIDGMVNAVRSGLGIGLVNLGVLGQRAQGGRLGERRSLRIDHPDLPQAPPIQHVARFSSGMPTRQMDKLLEAIKSELGAV